MPGSLAISGPIVAAGGWSRTTSSYRTFVFTEPSIGWSGHLIPSAQLTAPAPANSTIGGAGASVAISGRYVFAGAVGTAYVYNEPRQGWSGTITPAAQLEKHGGDVNVVVDGNTLLAIGEQQCGSGHYVAPCASFSVFDEPVGGWTSRALIPAT